MNPWITALALYGLFALATVGALFFAFYRMLRDWDEEVAADPTFRRHVERTTDWRAE